MPKNTKLLNMLKEKDLGVLNAILLSHVLLKTKLVVKMPKL
jgi:hypothetical protein